MCVWHTGARNSVLACIVLLDKFVDYSDKLELFLKNLASKQERSKCFQGTQNWFGLAHQAFVQIG